MSVPDKVSRHLAWARTSESMVFAYTHLVEQIGTEQFFSEHTDECMDNKMNLKDPIITVKSTVIREHVFGFLGFDILHPRGNLWEFSSDLLPPFECSWVEGRGLRKY